jgi:uncharacterized membrane protein
MTMTRKLLHTLSILVLALFATQGRLLKAQSADRAGSTRDSLGLRQERRRELALANSRASSSQIPTSDRDSGAMGLAKTRGYEFRSIDYPGASYSVVFDFNGETAVGCTVTDAFAFHGSSYVALKVPGYISCAYGINASGAIVGAYVDSSNNDQGFLYDGSRYTTIDYPGSVSTLAWDINDAGLIVGYYIDSNAVYHGFLYNKGTFTAISFPGADDTIAYSINSSGDIVGSYDYSPFGNGHGFLLSNGVYSSLDFPLANATFAQGINDAGTIAGYYDLNSIAHGFTYAGGVFTTVDVPGATETIIHRINNKKNVVGFVTDSSREFHGIIGK